MEGKAILFLVLLASMCAIFFVIVRRVYKKDRKSDLESPKDRMLED